MNNLLLYLKDSYREFSQKTTWPSLISLQRSTVIVILATVVFSLLIFAMDKALSTVLQFLYEFNK